MKTKRIVVYQTINIEDWNDGFQPLPTTLSAKNLQDWAFNLVSMGNEGYTCPWKGKATSYGMAATSVLPESKRVMLAKVDSNKENCFTLLILECDVKGVPVRLRIKNRKILFGENQFPLKSEFKTYGDFANWWYCAVCKKRKSGLHRAIQFDEHDWEDPLVGQKIRFKHNGRKLAAFIEYEDNRYTHGMSSPHILK